MRRDKLRFLRNIGIAAHIDAGKTTLTERILYFTGKSHRLGETHTGNSQMDTTKQEIEKGITISSAATHTEWTKNNANYFLNIIDTPGHVDFMIEVERSLRVLDGMVALFDAEAGVEAQTETVWQQAARYQVPVIAMVNKMDKLGANFFNVVEQMKNQLGANAIPLQIPIGAEEDFKGLIDLMDLKVYTWNEADEMEVTTEIPNSLKEEVMKWRNHLIEQIVLQDEVLFKQYLNEESSLTTEQLMHSLRVAVLNRNIVPVFLGAAYKNKGVQTLLDAICNYLPSPLDRGAIEGANEEGQLEQRLPDEEAPFAALAFKIGLDEQNRQLYFFRVYAGSLKVGDTVWNPRTNKKERVGRLYQMHSNKRKEIQSVTAGDIAATIGFKTVRTGDTLCAKDQPILLENLHIPTPVIHMAVEAKQNDQMDKLGMALTKLQMEDPSFKVKLDESSGQTILYGMGELHLEIIIDKLKTDFDIEVNVGAPQVAYQEVFTHTVPFRHRLKKQKGGSGLFAEIEVIIGPADPDFLASEAFANGKRLQFVNKVVGGSIPKEFIPSIAEGFEAMLDSGALANYPVHSLKVELLDGDTHSNDSNMKAFERCAMETFRLAASSMKPQLLEPLVEVNISTPSDYMGAIIGGINRRRGLIISQDMEATSVHIIAEVPLAEMFGYINHLRTVSSGRANYSMKFKDYALLPSQLSALVCADSA